MKASSFQYELPESRIARYPLEDRAASKLLVYQKGKISHHRFRELLSLSGSDIQLIFNDTRVVPARLHFHKISGARIEIFPLEPIEPFPLIQFAMQAKGKAVWKTMVGNLKKWKDGEELELHFPTGGSLKASLLNRDEKLVSFTWTPETQTWEQVLQQVGKIPIPPYLNREAEFEDLQSYQTVYAKEAGAVAAPTAGLHFTPEIMAEYQTAGAGIAYLTLHVSAGTFQPLQAEDIRQHSMHSEQIFIHKETLEQLIEDTRHRLAIGTTALRTLESLYWYGVKLLEDPGAQFFIPKLFPYEHPDRNLPSRQDALKEILHYMNRENISSLSGETEIFILPGYKARNADSLLTNFHQPGSTLLVLVEALIGPNWRRVYEEAMKSDYRFLSYGDSSWLVWE